MSAKNRISIGIFAHNEDKNIGRLLDRLSQQRPKNGKIIEIIVVASGCTDGTEKIVKQKAEKDKRVKLISQKRKEGKVSAINHFLRKAKGDILVQESADTFPEKNAVEELVKPFSDPKVGIVGARPMAVDSRKTFIGFYVNLMWDLHHQIASKKAKLGEMLAHRNLVRRLPLDTIADETTLEVLLKRKGYKSAYAPKAVVYNKGPDSLHDLIKQRRRIYLAHIHLKERYGYLPPTENLFEVAKVLVEGLSYKPLHTLRTAIALILDVSIRILARYDYYARGKRLQNWETIESTKSLD